VKHRASSAGMSGVSSGAREAMCMAMVSRLAPAPRK
jgi:hypothetical protein